MNPIARFVVERSRLAWLLAVLCAVILGWAASLQLRAMREQARLTHMQTEVERRSIEVMSQTLNGNLMGAVAVLGLIDSEIKREALGTIPPNTPKVLPTLESIARSYDADGVFIVAQNGVATSSWDNSGKPSTGLNLKFRPYYQMSMQGMDNVYAAVSIARGDRSLYFAAPVFKETTSGTEAIGTVVARTGMLKVDALLRDKADIALLLSPQGVVFASNRPEWIGHLAGQPSPERLNAIRDLKQFGKMFDSKEPAVLPVAIETGLTTFENRRFAVAGAEVNWNDPFGAWKLVMMEDLERSLPLAERLWSGAGISLAFLIMGTLVLKILQSNFRQAIAGQQLEVFARDQQDSAARKERLADFTVRLQRSKSLAELAAVFLNEAHDVLGAMQGVVYVAKDDGRTMELAGSYACANPPPESIAVGEGLLGQCAAERRLRIVTVDPGHLVMVRSGLGEAVPAAVLLAPILLNDVLQGVVEIAVLRLPDPSAQAQLQELVGLLAMNIEIVSRSSSTEAMLAATREAERSHVEQVAFQQALVDTIPYPVFYKDRQARFVGVNAAYEKAFSVRREDLIGKRLTELSFIEDGKRAAAQEEDERLIAEMGAISTDTRVLLADGQYHDLVRSISTFRQADGQPAGLVGILVDVTEIRNAEREMDRLADMQRFNRLAQGREQRVLELKREVNALAEAAGKPAPYNTSLVETVADHELAPHPDYRTTLTDDGKPLDLSELVNMGELQVLLTNFCESVGVASAIIDLKGNVLAAARWQPACTDFHRANPESCARCIESDTELASQLQEGQEFTMYKCKNGMTDAAAPIIVEGRHLANVFIGQFHSTAPDLAFFRQQARQFAYCEEDYIRAIESAPVIDEQRLPAILNFLSGFAQMISTMSLARRRADAAQRRMVEQADLLRRERVAALSLAEDADVARRALESVTKGSQQ